MAQGLAALAMRRSGSANRLGRSNSRLVLALAIKAVFFVLAVFGQATTWMAAFADMGANLLLVFNGLRLLRAAM